ncbi:MAG: protein-glutamate O-methyltransferase CheR [Planctomycetes bacterium]|nr:protein-glutamate O-methyltransferase CheR [Planctomycetota bacterium]
MPLAKADADFLRQLVRAKSGIVLGEDKGYLLESRLTPLAKAIGLKGVEDLVPRLRSEPNGQLARQVVEAMTTNETFFFRDLHPFECLKKVVLPDLIAKRAASRRLDFWCAAASTGQEPYSVAIVLREHFPQVSGWTVRFLATDIATEVLKRARAGRYSQLEVNRGLPAPLLLKYFTKDGLDWVIKDDLKRMIEFKELNLLDAYPISGQLDVIFIRNVLIYFDIETKREILAKCRKLLRPDGYLFLGGAETTLNIDDNFVRVDYDKGGCYRLRGA